METRPSAVWRSPHSELPPERSADLEWKMASCLYECLCEAELEKYYPHFIAFGFQKIDELAKVSMKDYAKLGVHNMKDRKRLFQLIRIIKILQAEEGVLGKNKQNFHAGGLHLQPRVTRAGPRRQLHFENLSEEKDGGSALEAGFCTLPTCSINEDQDDLAAVLGHNSDYKQARRDTLNLSAARTEYKLDIPTISSSSDIAPLLGDAETPIVHRVTHISGYNYGVPHSCFRPDTSEKEIPWTEKDKIRVCVRKRPLGLREGRRGEVNIITVEDKETLLLHEKKEAVDLTQYILQHVFYFDEVFGEACSNHDVYMKTAHPLVQHVFNGGNATCFAYGQTGAGKTYTMIGTHQNPGLYALAAKDIFKQLETSPNRKDLHVWISFYEIYCGQLYDLLNGRKRLFAREDSKHVVQIVGLREVKVDTVSLLLEVILKGGKERSTGATGVNSDSSRSHAIIQIQIKDPANRVLGRISFIDLAGSERAADARDSDRQTKMEGAEINQSLLALKECIRALDQEQAHTPFRQSKLTQVLKDSFVGNSKTCMIANVSPSHIATEHTLNTLRYADRVKELKKGMKCCPPSARNRCTVGNLSPKRIQSSPGIQAGEKSSPKKVKLGVHHPPTPARTKTPLFLCPPGHSPFSSTPKAQARKGHAGSSLPGQPSPVKGAGRAGTPVRKTMEDPRLPSEKGFFGKHFVPRTDALPRRESGQGDRQPGRCQKVQPVQKQLISRGGFSLGDTDHTPAHGEEAKAAISEQKVGLWASLPPHQKDREQHLRLYHQQFQQPPILHQKLDYQPLEKFLAQYKPQEIRVKQESPCEPPPPVSPPSQDETMQLEDLDDSDFSEDSFSPAPSRRKPEAEAAGGGSQGSFFLHQRECRPEDQDGRELIFRPRSGALLSTDEAACWEEAQMSLSDWSTEETAALKAFPGNDVPEKPYCSQGDSVVCSTQNGLLGPKQPVLADIYRGSSDKHFCLPEKPPQSPPAVCLLASARCAGSDQKGESVKGQNEEKHLQTGEDLCEALATSVDFLGGAVTPFTASLLGTQILDVPKEEPSCQWQRKEVVGKQSLSPVNQLYEDTIQFLASEYEMDHFRKQTGRGPSPPAEARPSSQPRLSSSKVGQDCICGLSAGDAGLEGLSVYEESALWPGECAAGTNPGADGTQALWKFGLGEEEGTSPATQLKPVGVLEKSLLLDAASISGGSENKKSSEESLPLQPSLEFRKLELDRVQEAFKFTLEEMRLLTNKWLPSALTLTSADAAKRDSHVAGRDTNTRSPKASFTAYGQLDTSPVRKETSSGSLQCKEALERQFVLQVHQEQLDEMAALCLEEESLISQMLDVDLEGLVVRLDEMLMLKSRCIQRMRTQLQPFLAAPHGMVLQRRPPT